MIALGERGWMPHIYNALSKGLVSPLHFIFMPPSTTTKVLQAESQQCHWGKSLQAEAEGVSLFTIENMGKLMSLSGRGQRTSRGGGQWIQAFYLSGGFMHRPLPIFHLVSHLLLLLSPLSLSVKFLSLQRSQLQENFKIIFKNLLCPLPAI